MKFQILIICGIFFLAAFLVGYLINRIFYKKDSGFFNILFIGMLGIWGTFEIFLVPMTFLEVPFRIFAFIYGIFLISICICSLFFWKSIRAFLKDAARNWRRCISWTLFLSSFLILFQLYTIHKNTYYEWDDASYVNVANEAVLTNSIRGRAPETGLGKNNDVKRFFSMWPIFYAIIGLWSHLSPTIIAHTVIPFIMIPFAYIIYFLMGQLLFSKDKEAQGYFLIFSIILHMFMTRAHVIAGSFLLMTPWMGKGIIASILIPAALYMLLRLTQADSQQMGDWCVLFLLTLSSCLYSPMGIILMPIFIGSLSLLWSLKNKKTAFFIKSILSCMPCIVFGFFYLILK